MDEMIERLKAELKAGQMSQAKAARVAGLPDSQGLRDALTGRKRLSAELLASLAHAGIDVLFVLIGRRSIAPVGMAEAEIELFNRLINIFWNLSDESRETAQHLLSALSLKDVQAGTARGVRKPKVAADAGALHDAGKSSGAFQDKLAAQSKPTPKKRAPAKKAAPSDGSAVQHFHGKVKQAAARDIVNNPRSKR